MPATASPSSDLALQWDELRERVREDVAIERVAEMCGVTLRKAGKGKWMALCPFHTERSPSMVIGGRMAGRAHCMGCGWDGDIFAFWQQARSVDFKQALVELAGLAGLPLPSGDAARKPRALAPRRTPERVSEGEDEKPELPPLRQLRPAEVEQLARVRGLSEVAVRLAAYRFKRIAASEWPLYRSLGEWLPRSSGAYPSWCITDKTFSTAEFRRLDNALYERADGSGIKAWSTRGKNWPIGAADMGGRPCVLLVEGGPDLLAAYHFLAHFRMLDLVAVVCMLGASNRMRECALKAFEGKRVRILADADPLKDDDNPKKRVIAGLEAALRWQEQLQEHGAAVRVFNLGPIYAAEDFAEWQEGKRAAAEVRVDIEGLRMTNGELVKDLNDLAKCERSVYEADWVRAAFCEWGF